MNYTQTKVNLQNAWLEIEGDKLIISGNRGNYQHKTVVEVPLDDYDLEQLAKMCKNQLNKKARVLLRMVDNISEE